MLDYLQKFNNLPKQLRDKISTPGVVSAIEELEKKYGISLSIIVMKIAVKDLDINDSSAKWLRELGVDQVKARQLIDDLKSKVFYNVADYLNLTSQVSTTGAIAKEQSISFKSKTVDQSYETGREKAAGSEFKGKSQLNKGANFFFSPEDEEEIRELSKKINGYSQSVPLDGQLDEKIDNIIKQTQINFGSEVLVQRFKQILKTYLCGIRDRIETKQALLKPFYSGGLSFDEDSTDKVLLIADSSFTGLDQATGIRPLPKIKTRELEKDILASLNKIGVRDFEYDLDSMPPKIKTEPPPTLQAVKNIPKAEVKPIIRRQSETESKIKVEDVKFIPRVMDPVDELKYIDLVNFRRLDKDPVKTINKIKGKIELLEEEAYSKRLLGIKAWRLSPINKLYLEMGRASISENKPIDVIIEERKIKGQNYLNNREFEAVMDLNKNLRF